MSIKHKHYPHPVLRSQYIDVDPDFIESFYEVDIQNKLSENKEQIELAVTFDLKNTTLNRLIFQNKAVFVLLFVCESTSTRFLKYTYESEKVFNIPTKNLNNTVMIQPYILAEEDIRDYKNEDTIELLKKMSFDVKRGDILAIATNYELYIEKDPVLEVDSIFDIIENKNKNADQFAVDPAGTKIKIHLPSEVYQKVEIMTKYSGLTSKILISLIYLPAVINALEYMASLAESEQIALKDYSWYRTLETKLIDLKLGNELSTIDSSKVLEIAHQIMELPNTQALEALDKILLEKEE